MQTINFWPILVATIVSFGISAIWYSPILFGKEWMNLVKMTDDDVANVEARGIWKFYIIQIIITLISFCVLAFIIASTSTEGGTNGAFMGFIVWIGFILTNAIESYIWEKRPFKLILINSVSMLINLVIGGAIIGSWR